MHTTARIVEQQIREKVTEAVRLQHAISRENDAQASGGFLGLSPSELRGYSVLRAIRGKLDEILGRATGYQTGGFGGVEKESHQELVTRFGEPAHQGTVLIPADVLYRDLNVANAGQGGYLVGTKNGSFVDALRNFSAAFRLGAQRMPGQKELVKIPRQAGQSTIVWFQNEAGAASESAATFEQISGSPKICAAFSEISRQLLLQTDNTAAESVILRGLAADVAVAADQAVFAGSGANGQPQGIIGTNGVGSVSGASLSYIGLVKAQHDIAHSNAVLDPNSLGYVTTPTVAQLLKGRHRFTGTDSPLWAGAIHQGEIEGVRALSTKQLPSATMIYGDFSQCAIGEWGVLAVEVNPFQDFRSGIVGVRALYALDVFVLHPESFTVIATID